MTGSVEQSLRQQVKDEIGDDEGLTFKQKNMLLQKFGLQPAFVPNEELEFWEDLDRRANDVR
jgi:hypothetical protein